ncbi:MAG TPA: right-handed parallel beta-helix repeat-containing protein [Candidatus Eisenbacteria bacterium]|nr:right-handed parallel beta-helix repeat-containing protein [Candidatus Eisenbacteria bacterium]
MEARRVFWVVASVLAAAVHAAPAGATVPCTVPATLAVVSDNRSADGSVMLTVSGERVATSGACDNGTTGFATSYSTTIVCDGPGIVKCGRVPGLAPGLWIHRVTAQVAGSAFQVQAQRGVILGGPGSLVSNVVEWTIFGRSFVVTQATDASLFAQLDAAQAYTASSGRPALVRFDRNTFPGAGSPQTIAVKPACLTQDDAICTPDHRATGYCLEGSDVTVDALDNDALPGAVVVDAGTCTRSLLRIYGSDNVLRGLVLRGSQKQSPVTAIDTIAISGLGARRNRLEECTVVGPTLGDAISVEANAGAPDGLPDPENVITGGEITGAEDKGIKVVGGGMAHVERSCIHDNANGGIQATLGGTVTAIENVVQHNVGGAAQNGLFVGVPETVGAANALTTRGNVVRFNGNRGISVVNNGAAVLVGDVVANNYQAGIRVETTLPNVHPTASVRGAGFTCNYAPGACFNSPGAFCREDGECTSGCIPGGGAARGVGAALAACTDPGCQEPSVDFGTSAGTAGRNALALNANPMGLPPGGINFSSALTAGPIAAAGNQWEHCDTPAPDPMDPNACYVDQAQMLDVRLGPGAAGVDLGAPPSPRHGPTPVVTAITPPRPYAGQLVRVYGGPFNAVDGAACQPNGLPADACSAENSAVATTNAAAVEGNRVTVTIGGQALAAEVHQVTPGMLVFKMPVDCFAQAVFTVARGSATSNPVMICDPDGCADRPVGAPCDDDSVCSDGDVCGLDGMCKNGPAIPCGGQCVLAACDPLTGCMPAPADTPCEDGDPCTAGDHCTGSDLACESGGPNPCVGQCLTGTCDPLVGCRPADELTSCDDGDACTTGDHCTGFDGGCTGKLVDCDDGKECTFDFCDPASGCLHEDLDPGTPCTTNDACHPGSACRAGECDPGGAISCDDGDACTVDVCEPESGCTNTPPPGILATTCHFDRLRALVGRVPASSAALAKKLGARIGCSEDRVTAAAGAPAGSRRQKRLARRGLRCASRVVDLARNAKGLEATLQQALVGEAETTRDAIRATFRLP